METVLKYSSGTVFAQLNKSRKTLLKDVSFQICAGESLAVIGETGSGKTMTALSLMRLLPAGVFQEGEEILFRGKELPLNMRKLLGIELVYIPQSGLESLDPSKKIRHHLYDSLKKLGVPKKELAQEAAEKLRLSGLFDAERILDLYPFQLSGGMAQRVTISLAACSRAKLVIADEPTNGLDKEGKAAFRSLLADLFPDAALLMITHDIGAAALCSRILVLCGGKMMETGAAADVLSAPKNPYTKALLAALPENGMKETPVLRSALSFQSAVPDFGGPGDVIGGKSLSVSQGDPDAGCPFFCRCKEAEDRCMYGRIIREEGSRLWICR